MAQKIHQCETELVRINGRTLRGALNKSKVGHGLGEFSNTQLVHVCPRCNDGLLTEPYLPYLCSDGVMRTVQDLKDQPPSLDFCGFKFTLSALNAAIVLAQLEDVTTRKVEQFGIELRTNLNPEQAFNFSKQVCKWGGGQRVWANLIRRNDGQDRLGRILNDWFSAVINKNDDEVAISLGIEIKGLGVSFASKHLRMIFPDRYAVLDEVLSLGLGFALNTKGYLFFLRSLRQFQTELRDYHSIRFSVASIESGIFMLIRQQVRAQ
ncbi:MAG TPA: hypothetical protein VMW07_05940 [Gallionella sp.]|nr:hypothetical protein [Gallionella sp.]